MAEFTDWVDRHQAAKNALAAEKDESLQEKFLEALKLSGIALLPGSAAYKELMSTLIDYSKETGQGIENVLADSTQMKAILQGAPADPFPSPAAFKEQERIWRSGIENRLLPPYREGGGPEEWERNEFHKALNKAQKRTRRMVKYSEGGQSPALGKFSEEIRTGRGASETILPTPRKAMNAWKKSVDPEFLDELTFVHWTEDPEDFAGSPKGGIFTEDALSVNAYLKDDPTPGFYGQRWSKGSWGLIMEGDVTWLGNQDAMTTKGTPGSGDYLLDPIVDRESFLEVKPRSTRRLDKGEALVDKTMQERPWSLVGTDTEVFGTGDLHWTEMNNQINEGLIQKSRVKGIIATSREGVAGVAGRAIVLAEEMGIPIFDETGAPLPSKYQPSSVTPEQIKSVSRNFPSKAEVGVPFRHPLSKNISGLENAWKWSRSPSKGGVLRTEVRNLQLWDLNDEIELHEIEGHKVKKGDRGIHAKKSTRHRTLPRTSIEELEERIHFVRNKPDFNVLDDRGQVTTFNKHLPEKIKRWRVDARLDPTKPQTPIVPKSRTVPNPEDKQQSLFSQKMKEDVQKKKKYAKEAEFKKKEAELKNSFQKMASEGTPDQKKVAQAYLKNWDTLKDFFAGDKDAMLDSIGKKLTVLGRVAGIAGAAYEANRLAKDIKDHGALKGTGVYLSKSIEETGELAQVPEELTGHIKKGWEEMGYTGDSVATLPPPGVSAADTVAKYVGKAGKGLKWAGDKMLKGLGVREPGEPMDLDMEREPEELEELDPSLFFEYDDEDDPPKSESKTKPPINVVEDRNKAILEASKKALEGDQKL